jgi:putative hydrolase of the HAD superfamily
MASGRSFQCAALFDGDDTLWFTEPLYDQARAAARVLVEGATLDGELWERLQRETDAANVATLGYSPRRFPTSCVQAYEELCRGLKVPQDDHLASAIWSAASQVFKMKPAIADGAAEVLRSLREAGFRLALLTKGDPLIQRNRIETSGLEIYFDRIVIVQEKTPETLVALLRELDALPGCSWMIGNSVRSDILPAIEAGIRAIWIKAHVWEHERTHDHLVDDRILEVPTLKDVLGKLTPLVDG